MNCRTRAISERRGTSVRASYRAAPPMHSCPLIYRHRARRRGTLRIDETWADGGKVICRTRVIREHTIEVQLPEGVRRLHRAGIAVWVLDQTRRPQGCEAVWVLNNVEHHPCPLSKRWSCSIVTTHKTHDHCARSQIMALHSTRSIAYGERAATQTAHICCIFHLLRSNSGEGVSIWVRVGSYSTDP